MKTKSEALRWIKAQEGKWIDIDGWYGAQCVDLILAYFHFLGVTPPRGNAKEWVYLPLPKGFVRVENYPEYLPEPGDIVVWNTGVYGHIGIVMEATRSWYVSMEQNVNGDMKNGGPATVVRHGDWDNTWFIRPPWKKETKEKPVQTNPEKFIKIMKPMAIDAWQRYKILPSLTIAQAALESGWGTSKLARQANALFGIKVHSGWEGRIYYLETWEEDSKGNRIDTVAAFRAYDSWQESVEDRSRYLTQGTRYKKVIGERDYKKACEEIKNAGYATANYYVEVLIDIIEYNKLYKIDKMAFQMEKDSISTKSKYSKEVTEAMDNLIKAIREEQRSGKD